MSPRKSIFRQPGAKHFQLVHRSQRDPLIHDPEANQHVLKSFERGNTKKACTPSPEIKLGSDQKRQGKSRADLETLLSPEDIEHKGRNTGEAALYGVYYDDTEYDYMQHLRAVGIQEDGVDSILIEAPPQNKTKGKEKMDSLFLPKEALPSTSELPRNYESQQAIPESIAGFQPDMNPHLRQVLEALEDDAFVDDELTDDFFGELIEDGERESDDDVQFEFDESGIDDMKDEGFGLGGEVKSQTNELDWNKRFILFKNQASCKQELASDDEFTSEDGDTIADLPTISVPSGRDRRGPMNNSDASGYSMSSSSMYRNEALQTLDKRFDQVMEMLYNVGDETEIPSVPDEAPEVITSRQDFDAIVNEFLHDYEILGRKMKHKIEGYTGTDKLGTIRRALDQDDRVRVHDHKGDDVQDLIALETGGKEDRWDCETILTTYSNLENHPRIIGITNPRSTPKIYLDPKTGLPLVKEPPSTTVGARVSRHTDVEGGSGTGTAYKHVTISRPRNENKEDKMARKSASKAEKQTRRAEKRETKDKFGVELKTQKQVLTNQAQRARKL